MLTALVVILVSVSLVVILVSALTALVVCLVSDAYPLTALVHLSLAAEISPNRALTNRRTNRILVSANSVSVSIPR